MLQGVGADTLPFIYYSEPWDFLYNIMKEHGFPEQWIHWVRNLLISSSSAININGFRGDHFYHMGDWDRGSVIPTALHFGNGYTTESPYNG
jgi:hypothetical protein